MDVLKIEDSMNLSCPGSVKKDAIPPLSRGTDGGKIRWRDYNVFSFISISVKFGICSVVFLNGTLFEVRISTLSVSNAYFSLFTLVSRRHFALVSI